VGDIAARVDQDVAQVATVCSELMPGLIRIVVATLAAVIVMFSLSWRLGLCVLPFMAAFMLLRRHFRRTLQRLADRVRQTAGLRASFLTESLIGMTDVQLLAAEARFRRRFAAFTAHALRAVGVQRTTEVGYNMGSLGVFAASMVVTLGVGASEIQSGRLTLGGYVAFYTLLTRLFDPLAAAAELYSKLKRVGASVKRIAELEGYAPTLADSGKDGLVAPGSWRELECESVGFGYPPAGRVLAGVDLVLRRGERIALLGRSGGGKSTMAALLARLQEPTEGRLLLDGVDIRSVSLRDLRRLVCVVPQDSHLFQGTLLDNATIGAGHLSAGQLEQLSQVACFDDVVGKLSAGWLHELGPGGSGLSEGEKQRLVLLRGLLRGCPLLVLDETTSALDPLTEAKLLERLKSHSGDKCLVLITHRLSTALTADRIVVVQDGRLVREWRASELEESRCDLESLLWATEATPSPRFGAGVV
jgi:ATP-binding cassette subfamily B protein